MSGKRGQVENQLVQKIFSDHPGQATTLPAHDRLPTTRLPHPTPSCPHSLPLATGSSPSHTPHTRPHHVPLRCRRTPKQRSMPLLNHMAKRIHDARRDKTGQVGYFFASELKLLAATLHESLYVYPEKGWPKMQAVAWAFYVIQLRVTRRAHEELAIAAAEAAAAVAETQRLAEETAAANRAEGQSQGTPSETSICLLLRDEASGGDGVDLEHPAEPHARAHLREEEGGEDDTGAAAAAAEQHHGVCSADQRARASLR